MSMKALLKHGISEKEITAFFVFSETFDDSATEAHSGCVRL
ncbi:Uncharacterised protein [Enterobacter hormaechei]|nr:Uncharacterised protein [Enterobacter hormaechei]SAG61814.1 Uncharacterised protein [Enterobacter cloacae]CZV13406.1 Uncharacterised protein [Enterobacter hormaechei]CZW08923.1 Uncharacterised protein [Enterobacter hormaechei]SAC78127.1 Uncharacterised protein [Enterobacter hormaechei]